MKILRLFAFACLLLCSLPGRAQQPRYDTHFENDRLRIDFLFAGDAHRQLVFLDGIVREGTWSGTRTNLIPPFDYGEYWTDLYGEEGELLFRRGFSSLFQEWRSTAEARVLGRAFTQSVWIPCPRKPVRLEVKARVQGGEPELLYSFMLDPSDVMVRREENGFPVVKWLDNGPVEHKVDICLIPEGYTAGEMEKFYRDAERLTGYLFECEPFRSRRSDFNVWIVEAPSAESGVSIPQEGIWRNTAAASHFNTFYIDRYLTAPDHRRVAQLASGAPNDALYVIVNDAKYGGGGIYNFYALSTADHPATNYVFPHEFGHSFAGLADEYYEKDVAYQNLYPAGVEPWEPNITTMADFASKWQDMIAPGTPLPTPNDPSLQGTVGLFEGGGYVTKGVWRPWYDCRMKSNTAPAFCPVCRRAISRMIDYYCR